MRVSQAIGRVLVDGGIEAFFGLAGSGNFAVLNALHAAGAAFYSSRHECGAVAMADGYIRACGKIAVASVHQGPGFTNTLTGLTEAAKCRTPLLVLAAEVSPSTLWSNFKIEQGILAETVGAVTERVRGPETAAADTARALRRARIERRPVVLNIPINLVDASCDGGSSVVPDWPALEPPRPSDRSVVEVADLLEGASHPAIVAGRGAALSGAHEALAGEIALGRSRDEPYEEQGTAEHVDPRTLSIALDDLLPKERTVATDSGHFLGYPSMYLSVPDHKGFVFPNAFQSVG